MSSTFLKSHEDLSGYLEVLEEHHRLFNTSLNSMPLFSQDPEETIKDLLSHLVSTKKKAIEVTKLAKKFYKVQEDSVQKSKELVNEIYSIHEEVNHLLVTINSQEKEIDSKDKRLDEIEHEMHVMEKEYRCTLQELQSLRKENRILKELKQPVIARQKTALMRENEDYEEENKNLKNLVKELEAEIDRKAQDIEAHSLKIKEILAFANNERAASEKVRMAMSVMKAEIEEANEKIEDLEVLYDSEKGRGFALEQEVMRLKNYIDLIVKEHEKERKSLGVRYSGQGLEGLGNFDDGVRRSESFDSDFDGQAFQRSGTNAKRTETLSDWINEEDEEEEVSNLPQLQSTFLKSKTYFVLTSPSMNSSDPYQKLPPQLCIQQLDNIPILAVSSQGPDTEVKDSYSQETSSTSMHQPCHSLSYSPQKALLVFSDPVSIEVLKSYSSLHPHNKILQDQFQSNNTQMSIDPLRNFFILVFFI